LSKRARSIAVSEWGPANRVTRYDRDIDMGYHYGISMSMAYRWDIDGISIWDMGYGYGIWDIDIEAE